MKLKNKKINHLLFTVSAVALSFVVVAQDSDNLVENPSFENAQARKIRRIGDIERAEGWTSATGARADIFVSGAAMPDVDVPNNIYGSEEAKDGANYAGIIAYSYREKEDRTYLQSQLSTPLKKGMRYKVQFYASLAELSKYSSNRLGAYLSKKPIGADKKMPAIIMDNTPVEHPDRAVFNGMYGWDLVCGEFVASGNEKYITIGNFSNETDIKTDRVRKPRDAKGNQVIAAYYYIDDISVTLLDPDEDCNCDYGDAAEFETMTVYQRTPEISLGMNVRDKVSQYNIYYASGRYDVRVDGKNTLESIAKIMKDNPGIKIQISGHADATEASSAEDKVTSLRRAEYVRSLLGEEGIDVDRIIATDSEDATPSQYIQAGDSDDLKAAKNRRVSFKVI